METKLHTLKNELKAIATEIKETKLQRKTVHFKGTRTLSPLDAYYRSIRLGQEFRAKHVAYCMIRGKKYEDIEKVVVNDAPMWSLVNKTIEAYDFTPEEKEAFAERQNLYLQSQQKIAEAMVS